MFKKNSNKYSDKGKDFCGKKNFFTKIMTHLTRPWSLAKRLEHISNRGKWGRGKEPKG